MKKLLALLLACAMVLSLAACGSSSSSDSTSETESTSGEATETGEAEETVADSSEPVYGGSLTVYLSNLSALSSYEPAVPDFAFYMIWYEQLWTLDWSLTDDSFTYLDENNMSGQIADTWEFDADAMTLTVQIRDDIYFQTLDDEYDYYGGRNLVASDVKYSYDRLFGWDGVEQVSSMVDWTSTLDMLESVSTDGDYTVIFQFNTSDELAVNDFMLGFVNIIGPEWDELTEDQQSDWHYVSGTGAYIISDCVEGSYITLTKNENYYDYDERYPENKLPYLDELTLIYASDSATLQSEFIAGELDLAGHSDDIFTSSELAQIYESMDDDEYTAWSVQSTSRAIILKQTVEAFQDINVRIAMQYAINMEEIATAYFGYDEWSIPGVFSSMTPYDSTSLWDDDLIASYYTYDPEYAMELLEEAGYGDGFTFEFVLQSSSSQDLYLLVQEYLAAVGITMEITTASTTNEVTDIATDPEQEVTSMINLGTTGLSNTAAYWKSSGTNYRLGGEDTLDALIAEVDTATTLDEQSELAQAFDMYIMENHYALAITPVEFVTFLSSSDVGGYNGEQLYQYWNCGTILSRLWDTAGE